MAVELSPVEDLDVDQELLDFAPEQYCANCTHFRMQEGAEGLGEPERTPYCMHWEDETTVESGMICAEYRPQGYRTD